MYPYLHQEEEMLKRLGGRTWDKSHGLLPRRDRRKKKKNGKGKPRKLTFKWLNYLSAGLYNTVVYLSKLASEQPKKFSVSFPNKYNLYTNKWSDNFGNHLKSGQEPKRWPCSSQNVKDIIDDFVCLVNLPPAHHFIFKIHKSLGLKY